ncbi:hypothetical protein QBC44DRAFT_371843 [Cladorrhinum sp. PSN332]|nr:hypothetical protein QBC44DRAFT_371843 [Cladorrhinum sp. PSN332]
MALDQSGRGIGFLRPSSLGVGIGLNKFNVVARGKSSPLEPPVGHSSFLKTILNIQGFNAPDPASAPGPLESVIAAEKVVSTVQVESVPAVEPETAAPVQLVTSVEVVTSTEPESVPEPVSIESTTIAIVEDVPAALPTEELAVVQDTETKETETQTEDLTTSPTTFLTLTPALAPSPPAVNDTKILVVDSTWVDESFDAPVTPEKILALLEKAPGSAIVVEVKKVPASLVVEEVAAPVVISEEVPAPVSEDAAPEPVPEVVTAPVVIPVEKVLVVDPTWMDASLDAPVDAATILTLPLGSAPVVEEAAGPVEEIAAAIQEPVAPVEEAVAPVEEIAAPVEIEERSQEEDVVVEEASVAIEPATAVIPVPAALIVDPLFTDDSFTAPVTPETILALPNGITVIAIPTEEEIATAVSEPEVVAISEPEAAPVSEPEVATVTVSEPEAAPVSPVIEASVPVTECLAVDPTWTDSTLEAPVTPEKLLALPDKVLSAPISVISCVPASPVSGSSSFPRLTSDEAVIQTAVPVINAHGSSVAIALEHIEDITAFETPVTQSSSSSFSPATTTTEDESFSSASSVTDLEIVVKPANKTVRIIEPIVWPVIHEDDFDAAVSSVLPAEFELESVMGLDLSWTIPHIKQSERDPKEVAAEKTAVKALVRGNLQGRMLADAAERLDLVLRRE